MIPEQARERVRRKFAEGKSHKPRNGHDHEASPLRIISYAEAMPQLDAPYLVKGFIHPREFSAMIGAPGCGKTFLALDMDVHIAAGREWFGHRVRQTPVVYLAAEGGTAILNRIAAIKARLGFEETLSLAIIPASLDMLTDRTDTDALIKAIGKISERFGQPVGKVSIDTLSRVLAGGSEDHSEDMGALIHNIDRLREAANCHAMLVHHTTKDGGSGKGGRGHSSLWGALDTEIDVHRDPVTKIATASVYKQRNGPEGAKICFALDSVDLGIDSDGDSVSSCVIAAAAGEPRQATARMSPACTIALSALKQAIEAAGEWPPSTDHPAGGIKGVPLEVWRTYAYQRQISDTDKPDSRKKAFKRASEQLQARGVVGFLDGFTWIAP